jgi:hypothetical protein
MELEEPKDGSEDENEADENSGLATESAEQKKRKKPRKRGKKKKKADAPPSETANPAEEKLAIAASGKSKGNSSQKAPEKQVEVDKTRIETKDEIRQRLREGVKKDYSEIHYPVLLGTATQPAELQDRTPPIPDDEIDTLLDDIAEIKKLLFCRQILRRPGLLPAALRANSIEEFMADPEIPESELRDLCLRVEQPSLQALRDACADFARGDEPEEDESEEHDEIDPPISAAEYLRHHNRYGDLEGSDFQDFKDSMYLAMMTPEARKHYEKEQERIFRETIGGDLRQQPDKKVKVRICGKDIWNYASQSRMARDGWLQFSIMAKDCSFEDAIGLCRNWDEFSDLNALAIWQFFPASKWFGWAANFIYEELIQMVCFGPCCKIIVDANAKAGLHPLPRVLHGEGQHHIQPDQLHIPQSSA